jgi:aminopeptidase N
MRASKDKRVRRIAATGSPAVACVVLGSALLFLTLQVQAQEVTPFSKQNLAPSVVSVAGMANGWDPVNVLHYDLSLTLAMTDESMGGRADLRLVLENLPGGSTDRIVLQAAKLQIDSVRINGIACTVILDTLAEEIALAGPPGTQFLNGDTLKVSIDYRRLAGVKRPGSRWGYYYFRDSLGIPSHLGYTMSEPSDARFWMPCHDVPTDKVTAEVRVTVPAGYVAASNGKLLEVTQLGDGRVQWHWRELHPIAPYLMCVTAAKFTISTLPFVRAVGDTVPLQYYTWSPDSAQTAAYLPTVHAMISGLSGLFGPYPFDKYGMTSVVPFGYGGMEHQTLTTMNRYLQTDERVVVHEMAHQWWGDLVTCGTWRDIWLNESFATYSEALWAELTGGKPALQNYMVSSLQHFYYGSWQGALYDPEGQGFNLFDDVVYSKGAWILHTLRGVIGDSAFFHSLHAYRARYAGGNATSLQFQGVVDSVTGTSMSWFFNQWVFGKGWPVYGVQHVWTGDSLVVTITQRQSASWPVFQMPLELRLQGRRRDSTVTIWNDARIQRYAFAPGSASDSVMLDPFNRVLKQVEYEAPRVTEEPAPARMALEQNYPNPFNGTTMIRFTIGESADGHVRLVVHDVLGREVAVVFDKRGVSGEQQVAFDASRFSSGVYLYTLQVGGRRESRPMLLIR